MATSFYGNLTKGVSAQDGTHYTARGNADIESAKLVTVLNGFVLAGTEANSDFFVLDPNMKKNQILVGLELVCDDPGTGLTIAVTDNWPDSGGSAVANRYGTQDIAAGGYFNLMDAAGTAGVSWPLLSASLSAGRPETGINGDALAVTDITESETGGVLYATLSAVSSLTAGANLQFIMKYAILG